MLRALGRNNLQVSPRTAQEIAEVGILPSATQDPAGHVITINDQPFIVTGHATREEFLEAVERVIGPQRVDMFRADLKYVRYFLRVSTD